MWAEAREREYTTIQLQSLQVDLNGEPNSAESQIGRSSAHQIAGDEVDQRDMTMLHAADDFLDCGRRHVH
jgi:hypothetical protein